MWFLYLDESGDLGFDFVNRRPSKFFTVAILAIHGTDNNRKLINGVKNTINRKLNCKKSRKRLSHELKGSSTILQVKQYFYRQVKDLPFRIFAVTLDKRKVYERLARDKERVYNYIARLVLDKIRFENADIQVELIVDKSKGKWEIKEFNEYIISQLKARFDPKVPLNIRHEDSMIYKGIQAADIFGWGIFRTYEKKDFIWFNLFKEKIKFNDQYL